MRCCTPRVPPRAVSNLPLVPHGTHWGDAEGKELLILGEANAKL